MAWLNSGGWLLLTFYGLYRPQGVPRKCARIKKVLGGAIADFVVGSWWLVLGSVRELSLRNMRFNRITALAESATCGLSRVISGGEACEVRPGPLVAMCGRRAVSLVLVRLTPTVHPFYLTCLWENPAELLVAANFILSPHTQPSR